MRCFVFTASVVALLAWVVPAEAQESSLTLEEVSELHLDDVHPGVRGERVVDLYLRALAAHGQPIDDLRAAHLEVRDGGERVSLEQSNIQKLNPSKRGVTWVIAIDVSKTMRRVFDQAKTAAVDLLESLESHDRVAVVTFAQTVDVLAPFSTSRAETEARVEGLDLAEMGTRTLLHDGVYEAVDLIRNEPDRPRRAAIIVFSDGMDGGSDHDLGEVIELARTGRILVYTIGYAGFGDRGLPALQDLANSTGAAYQRVRDPADVRKFFLDFWNRLMQSYVVRYPWPMDGEAHTVEIAIEGKSAALKVQYPDIAGPAWPWIAAGSGAAAAVLGLLLTARMRSVGRLVFVDGPRHGEVHKLRPGRVQIGAIATNDVVIPTPTVSRYHAELLVSRRRVEIKDLHSENGTLLNGHRVESAPIPIKNGDRIRIADVDMVYER